MLFYADAISFFAARKYQKKSKESIKIVNFEGEIFISSVRLEEFQWNIQERQDLW